jgi:hypothetical protein
LFYLQEKRIMTDQTPIATPAIRCDGWTPDRQVRFLDHLSTDGNVRAACARVGMSREAAYRRRRREPLFARAWDAALLRAREASAEVLASRALNGIEEEVWYKGELVGTRRKFESRLLLAHMARLDKLAEASTAACADAERFDELLAALAGEAVPAELAIAEDELPPARHETIARAREAAIDAWEDAPDERIDADCYAACDREQAEAAVRWDEWFARACATVDRLLGGGGDEALDAVRTVSDVSTSPATPAAGRAQQDTVAAVAPVAPSRDPRMEEACAIAEGYRRANPLNNRYARA